MSILLAQADEGGRVSDAEFENMFWLFAVAGNETLRNGLPGGLIAFLQHPEQLAALRGDPSLLPGAVDEMLRWWTPVMVFRRTAAVDVELGGTAIRAGDKIVVSFTAANRDERVFADPDRFDVGRAPNPHLSFGHGPHPCLGAQLARAQMRALFAELLRRTRSIELDGEPVLLRSNFQRGVSGCRSGWQPPDRRHGSTVTLMASPLATMSNASSARSSGSRAVIRSLTGTFPDEMYSSARLLCSGADPFAPMIISSR